MPLSQLNALYNVGTKKNRELSKTIIPDFTGAGGPPYPSTPTPRIRTPSSPATLTCCRTGGAAGSRLRTTRLTDTELAVLVFALSAAAGVLRPADARLGSIRAALAAAYPGCAVCAQHLCSARRAATAEATVALSSGSMTTIRFTVPRSVPLIVLVDPYALVLHRDHMYLHAWCHTAENVTMRRAVKSSTYQAFAHAVTGRLPTARRRIMKRGEPNFWRNFRLTRINHIHEAGAGRTARSPVTPFRIGTRSDDTQTNPFAELRIHPTEHIPSDEPLDTLTATYGRRSTHRELHAPSTMRITTTANTALAIRTSSTPSSRTEGALGLV